MRYNIIINQIMALKFDLNLSEATLFAFCYELPSWAESIEMEGKLFYYSAKNKILSELPILTSKHDTVYRLLKILEAKDLIQLLKVKEKDYIRTTAKGKGWNNLNPEVGKKSDYQENNPLEVGNLSGLGSEKNPTYNNTNKNNNTNDKESLSPLEIIKNKKTKFYNLVKEWQKANPKKYPAELFTEFIKYWTEPHKSKVKIRYDDQDFFDIGKRMATFRAKKTDEEMSKMWERHNTAISKNIQQPNLFNYGSNQIG